MDVQDAESSATSSPYYGARESLVKVQDIGCAFGQGIPPHIQSLNSIKGDQDFISVHELSARLCHVLLVETGFFPSDGGGGGSALPSPQTAMEMSDHVRIPEFSSKLAPSCMYSEQGIYALKYKAILCHLVDLVENAESAAGDVDMSVSDADMGTERPSLENKAENIPEQEWRYDYSNDINVTMLIMEDRLNITATCNIGEDCRPISHLFTLNIEEFFIQRAKMLPVKLRGDQWMKKFEINYTRLSVYFKSKFAIHLMDQLDGVLFERRGLFSLPYLVLVKVLKKSDVVTILRMSKTCTTFYNVVRDNRLWKFLLKRDFPNELPEAASGPPPPMPGMMAPPPTPAPRSTPGTEPSSPPATDTLQKLKSDGSPDDPDYYEIYKQKYASKHRRLHRMNSFPIRLFPRIGRRIPSIPFHFDRF